jgi:hypothetical protein
MALTIPCATVEVALTDPPFTVNPTWTAITKVLAVDIEHGWVGEFDEYGPGTLELVVDNTAGTFDPDATSYWAPNQLVRVTAPVGTGGASEGYETDYPTDYYTDGTSTTYTLFKGFIDDDVDVTYGQHTSTVRVTATNLVRLLSTFELEPATFPEETITARFERVLTLAGVPLGWRQINPVPHLTPAETVSGGVTVWEYTQALALAQGGAVFVSKAGNVVFQDRHSLRTDVYRLNVQATFSDDAAIPGVRYSAPTWGRDRRKIRNRAPYSTSGGTVSVYEDATSVAAYTARDLDLKDLKVRAVEAANNRARWNVQQWKDPHAIPPSLVLNVIDDDDVAAQAIIRGLRERVRFVHTAPGTTQHDVEVFTERIRHRIEPASDIPWQCEIEFSPAERFDFTTPASWHILGTTLLGSGVIAP